MALPLSAEDRNSSPYPLTLVQEVAERFGIGHSFAAKYLDYWCETRKRTVSHLQEIMSLPAPEPMWFEYALTTNWRGRQLRDSLKPYLRPWYSRYLDVGCGFGGCMVAFAELGYESWGVEVDPIRVGLATENLRDNGFPLNANVLDILSPAARKTLGRFDFVSCIDVIEHVLDVPKTLETIVSLLSPGGTLVLEIPNKHFIPFVGHDGHFGLFGITLLDRLSAIEYHSNFFDFDYDVGDYYERSVYEKLLRSLGCEVEPVSAPLHAPRAFSDTTQLLSELDKEYGNFRATKAQEISGELSGKIDRLFQEYRLQLEEATTIAKPGRDLEAFSSKYLTDFWTIAARKRR